MFTTVYLCYSPVIQRWLAPFTRPQLELELTKTSNSHTSPLCPTPSAHNDLSHKYVRKPQASFVFFFCFFFFLISLHRHTSTSLFSSFFAPPWTTRPPTHRDLRSVHVSHPQSKPPPLSASVFVSAQNRAFYVMKACCSL